MTNNLSQDESLESSSSAQTELNVDAQREPNLLTFTTHDDHEIAYRHWPAVTPSDPKADKKAIVLFHRGHEHGGRMAHLVSELDLPDYEFFAWDARGHGLTPGERGYCPSFGTAVLDVDYFIKHIEKQHQVKTQDVNIVAQSVGAALISAWVHDFAPNIRTMILASPAFKIKLYVPFARLGLKCLAHFKGNFFINSYVKAKLLSHDPKTVQSFIDDPLISRAISVNMLLGLYDAAERVIDDAAEIHVPTQLFISGADFVVHKKPQKQFFSRLSSQTKELHEIPEFFHDTLGERDRAPVVASIRRFILQQQATDAATSYMPNLINSDKLGQRCAESEALAVPLPAGSIKDRYWQLQRYLLKLGSQYSDGIKLGFDVGFDSGSSLDYVYRNTPSGKGKFGTLVDKGYLNSAGWKGIRQRKVDLELLLDKTIQMLKQQQQPVRILDIAAGHGRYVIEAIENQTESIEQVLLRDFSEINVADGQALIASKQLESLIQFVKGDAFDKDDLASLDPKPTLAIVSGLYELFRDNAPIQDSLAGVYQALEEGGYLIYTNQPWHPQLEYIARALTSHRDGEAWVMRRRSQAEMDQLVAAAGFEKIEQRIDEQGIFTVSIARKLS